MCPKILTYNIKTGTLTQFSVSSLKTLMSQKTTTGRLGFKDFEALAYQDPVLLVSSLEHTLIPNLKFLESIGFSSNEAKSMVLSLEKRIKTRHIEVMKSRVKLSLAKMLKSTDEEFEEVLRNTEAYS
ncbi:hypothetical protein F3Y22_tig00013285pilonHSYRG00079 [Hibiscus syriacus]|uniref:Uncharacterized protein n=1 Tax=Hibiscus syriacus TaxID=106335 RepID=A0A6A3C7D2_HIBSY|nr:hypothetical protein F3Y22_tig00013285pilonHSYRG00079 [Hibiscus syriacus]